MTHEALENLIAQAEADCREVFRQLDETEAYHTGRVIRAFQKYRVAGRHFAPSTGYGFDDIGRDTLSLLFAELLGVEKALVRPQIASGTHALAVCLFGVLRPGDKMLSAAGSPYDTMEEVIGLAGEAGNGSLKDYGVDYAQVELKDGKLDLPAIMEALTEDVKLVLIQRSRGYDWRPSLDVADINAAIDAVTAALVKGDKVQVSGFGTFETKEREARVGRNPHTKEAIEIPATRVPAFKASKALKDIVAK